MEIVQGRAPLLNRTAPSPVPGTNGYRPMCNNPTSRLRDTHAARRTETSSMSDIYREQILDHYRNPRNHGTLDPNDATFEDTNPLCGDRIRMDLRFDGDKISEIRFTGRGCAITQASASMLTELVEGQQIRTSVSSRRTICWKNLASRSARRASSARSCH